MRGISSIIVWSTSLLTLFGCGIGYKLNSTTQSGTPSVAPVIDNTLCSPMNPPTGNLINVQPAQAAQLPAIVAAATSGSTILLADGVYTLNQANEASRITFLTDGVTMRSQSGIPENVILDGQYATNELIDVQANNITLAEFTVTRANNYLIHVTPPAGATSNVMDSHFFRLRLIDSAEQFFEVSSNAGNTAYADYSYVQCSYFQLTAEGQENVASNSSSTCFTGGIDAHKAEGWTVQNNYFIGIYCNSGTPYPAIQFWENSRDTLVEDNQIYECAIGIGFGYTNGSALTDPPRVYSDDPYPGDGYIGHYDGTVRDNVIYGDMASYNMGLTFQQARGATVVQNTSVAATSATGFYSALDVEYVNSIVTTDNNLLTNTTVTSSGTLFANQNLVPAPLSLFVSPANLNFELLSTAASAIGQGVNLGSLGGYDPNGYSQNLTNPSIGAYEPVTSH
jgi:hypothetical protein